MDFNPEIPGYTFEYFPTPLSAGGVGMYIDSELRYTVLEKSSNEAFQALWVEIFQTNVANIICGVLYRQHNSPELFLKYFEETAENLIATGKPVYVMTDANINLLSFDSCNYAQDFFISTQDIHQYNTRSASSGNYYINYSRLNHHKNSFSIVGAKIWNSIPESYRSLPKHIFKKKIQALLFATLGSLDSYADASTHF